MSNTTTTINGSAQNPPGIKMFQAPSENPQTIRIASDDTEAGYIIINAEDFDAALMTEYREPAPR